MGAPTPDPEKGGANGLPDLSDVYGGIEDSRHEGGIAEHNDAISPSSASKPTAAGGSAGGSWFTKKRIIIISVVAVLVVAGAVGGAVGGVMAGRNNDSSAESTPSGTGSTNPTGTPTDSGSDPSGTNTGASGTATTGNPNPTATGIIAGVSITPLAFSGIPMPTGSSTPYAADGGFPGLTDPYDASSANLIRNGNFEDTNLTTSGWENTGSCWEVNDWSDDNFKAAWNGEDLDPSGCNLAQTLDPGPRGTEGIRDYMVTFLYRNSAPQGDATSQFWAFIGDDTQVRYVLSSKAGAPTGDYDWGLAGFKWSVLAGRRPRVGFRSLHSSGGYWEIAVVTVKMI